MLPNLISFVGVDEKTDLGHLKDLSDEYWEKEIVEFGVLYSPERAGKQKRYPSVEFIRTFLGDGEFSSFNPSLHLCGKGIDEFLDRTNAELIALAETSFPRIQLNFAMKNYDDGELAEKIVKHLLDYPETTFILQHNKSKAAFCNRMINTMKAETMQAEDMIHFLYDGSGGFGRELENPLPPIEGYYTGYAGGFGPESVERIVKLIQPIAKVPYYIDMESKIRTDDYLDISKCRSVLETVWKMQDAQDKIFA